MTIAERIEEATINAAMDGLKLMRVYLGKQEWAQFQKEIEGSARIVVSGRPAGDPAFSWNNGAGNSVAIRPSPDEVKSEFVCIRERDPGLNPVIA